MQTHAEEVLASSRRLRAVEVCLRGSIRRPVTHDVADLTGGSLYMTRHLAGWVAAMALVLALFMVSRSGMIAVHHR